MTAYWWAAQKGRHMRIYHNPSIHSSPLYLLCPACGDRMRLVMIVPVTSERAPDEITFRCEECDIELTRLTRAIQ
jgi:hypothetical protein